MCATRTPESCAAPTSIAVARIARPVFDRTSQSCMTPVMASAAISVNSFAHGTVTVPSVKLAPE